MDADEILAIIPSDGRLYDPNEIVLIGSHMEPSPIGKSEPSAGAEGGEEQIGAKEARRTGHLRVVSDVADKLTLTAHSVKEVTQSGVERDTDPTMAIIYAYAFEGHTYRLPKPRIMVVRSVGEPYQAKAGDDSSSVTGKLYMWRMSKHQHAVSIEVESGALETLVLQGNQPGNRSVNSYQAHMQLSHRGGRLT